MISRAPIFGELPSNLKMRLDYTSNDGGGNTPPTGQPSYQGFAKRGAADGDSVWTIYQYEYSGTNMITRLVAVAASWTDRETAEYA